MRAALIGVLVALAAATAATAQSDPAWQKVVAAAKQEGRVTLYSASVGTLEHVTIARQFEAKYGIKVDIFEARPSEMRARLRAESVANQPLADVMWNGTTSTGIEEADGMLQPVGELPRLSAVLPQFAGNGMSIPVAMAIYGILVNTKLVPPAEAPKSWHDLLDPRWKGKILADDMRAPGGGSVFFFATYDKFGRAFHEALAKQQLQFSSFSLQDNQRRVARGEFPLYLPMGMPDSLRLQGLPVRAVLPTEGSPYVFFSLSMLKHAPHPSAARLLINYFLEPDAREVFLRAGRPVSVAGDNSGLPDDVRAIADAKLLGTTDWTRQSQMLELATELYK
jgi:iron(III) transport system substrate-binding protein